MLQSMATRAAPERVSSALRIVLLYAVFAGLWILLSDFILVRVAPSAASWAQLSVVKGLLFVAVTSAFLYLLIAANLRRQLRISDRLAKSDARFRSYVENAPIAILVFDEQQRCVEINRAAAELTGLSQVRLTGRRRQDLLPPIHATDGAEAVYPMDREDGKRIWVQVSVVPLPDRHLLAFCRDVTQRVEAEETIRQADERLLQAAKLEAIGRLAGGIAHDFNNILTAVLGYADILRDRLGPDQVALGYLLELRGAATRAASLTQRLLTSARRQELTLKEIDLNSLLGALPPMLGRLIGEDVQIVIDPAEGLWAVSADTTRLEQAFINLAINARDAMPAGGTLTLTTRNLDSGLGAASVPAAATDRVVVTVADTGVGMDAQTRSHLFEPFFTTKDAGKGTGLGLATVYGIVRQLGGSIDVQSEPGAGTTFTLVFPRARGEVDQVARPPVAELSAPVDGCELILCVEDDDSVRDLLALILRERGYEVLTASSGAEAITKAETVLQRVALVITDVIMPSMTGGELVDRLRRMRPDLKFAFLSGYTRDVLDRHHAASVAMIEKPVDARRLLIRVREILDAKEAPP